MPLRECYHCHQWIDTSEEHDCWTTTERELTRDLTEDLMDAWERIRETAVEFGEQRIYASHKSIMFSRSACYFFVRPKKKVLEVCFFLGRSVKHPMVRKSMRSSKLKFAHLVHVAHRDQVEAPLTGWLQEAFETSESLRSSAAPRADKPAKPSAIRAKGKSASTGKKTSASAKKKSSARKAR